MGCKVVPVHPNIGEPQCTAHGAFRTTPKTNMRAELWALWAVLLHPLRDPSHIDCELVAVVARPLHADFRPVSGGIGMSVVETARRVL